MKIYQSKFNRVIKMYMKKLVNEIWTGKDERT